MTDRKKELHFFSIVEYDKEQDHLRKMQQSGWKFMNVSGLTYTFESCPPEDVIYQLDYNKEGLDNKDEYIQMFQDCGWEYVQDYGGYSYFRKPVSKGIDESIFCDNESRLEMMRRIFHGRLVPMLIVFALLLVPNFVIMDPDANFLRVLYIIIMTVYLWIFISFAIKYYRFKKRTLCLTKRLTIVFHSICESSFS